MLAAEFLRELAVEENFFKYKKSRAVDLAGVLEDVAPTVKVVGDATRIDEEKESGADQRYLLRTTAGKDFYVYKKGKKVWMDVSRLAEGEGGGAIYSAVDNYAKNTGREFVGDPAGLSEAAIIRRTYHMLGSALRHGTTQHFQPANEQLTGLPEKGIPPLKWQGNEAKKTAALVDVFLATIQNRFPEIANARYDFTKGQFIGGNGRPIDKAALDNLAADAGAGRAAKAGHSTLRAAILIQSLLRGEGSKRPGLLELALQQHAQLVQRGNLARIFRRGDVGRSTSDDVARWTKDLTWKNAPPIVHVQSASELPFKAPADAAGAFHDGKVYLVADNIRSPQEAEFTLFHEVIGHYGLRGFYGANSPELNKALLSVYMANPTVRAQTTKWLDANRTATKDMTDLQARLLGVEETLSDMAGHGKTFNGLRKLVAALQAVLRKIGLNRVADWLEGLSDAEALRVLANAKRFVEEGTITPEKTPGNDKKELATLFHRIPIPGAASGTAATTAANGFLLPEETQLQSVRRRLQDRFLRAKVIQDAIVDQGGTIYEASDIYAAEERFHGRVGARFDAFEDKVVAPLMKDIGKSGVTLEQITEYLYARHAPEANQRIAAINPAFPDGGSGMTTAEAATILAGFHDAGKTPELESFAKRVDKITKETRGMLLKEGLLDPHEHAAWEQTYQHYVPLKGLAKTDENGRPVTGKGFDVRGSESKRRTGRSSRASDIMENILQAYETALVRTEKNRVGKALLEFVQQNPDPDLWEINRIESKPSFVKVAVNGNQVTLFGQNAQIQNGRVVYRAQVEKLGDDVIAVKVGGQETFITLHDPLLARAMKNLGVEKPIKHLQALNRWLSLAYTGLNPVFTVVNFSRDAQTAFVHSFEKGGLKYTGQTAKHILSAMRGIYQLERGKSSPEWQKWYAEFRTDGGKTGAFRVLDIKEQTERINRLIKMTQQGKMNPKVPARALFNFVMDANTAVENATRLAAYRAARELGKSRNEAGSIAKNLTVNFNRKGEWGPVLGSLYLFFNPAVQGTARMAEAMTKPKVQFLVAGITATHALLSLLNFAAGDDDDGEPYWAKLLKSAPYEAERNLIIMIPGTKGRYIKIPMPYGYSVFGVLGTQLTAMAKGVVTPWKAGVSVYSALMGSFNPIGGSVTDVKTLALTLSPTTLDPILQQATNSSGVGTPLSPEEHAWDKRPASERYYLSQHGSVAQTVSAGLNEMTGGNSVVEGAVSIPPGVIDNYIRFFTGGAGQFMNDTASVLLATVGRDKDFEAQNTPFVKQLYGHLDVKNDMRLYYDNRKKATDALVAYEQYAKGGMPDRAQKLLDSKGKLLDLGDVTKHYDEGLSALRNEELAVVNDQTLSERQKTERRKTIEADKRMLFQQYNKLANEARQ